MQKKEEKPSGYWLTDPRPVISGGVFLAGTRRYWIENTGPIDLLERVHTVGCANPGLGPNPKDDGASNAAPDTQPPDPDGQAPRDIPRGTNGPECKG